MRTRTLPTTSIDVSPIAVGTWVFAGDVTWGDQPQAESIRTVHAALDAGINLFDTAEAYGNGLSERVLGKALAGRRDRAVVASKVSADHATPQAMQAACEASLERLGCDYIDLYHVHWPNRSVPIQEVVDALASLQTAGKIRAAAVSNFGPADLDQLLQVAAPGSGPGACVVNQLPYSLLARAIEYEIQPRCVQADMGILCYSPLAQGLLSGKFRTADDVPAGRQRTRLFAGSRELAVHSEPGLEAETFAALDQMRVVCAEAQVTMAEAALGWLMAQPGVSSVVVGCRTPAQSERNAQAAAVTLPAALLDRLSQLTDGIKTKLGNNPDLWQSDSRYR